MRNGWVMLFWGAQCVMCLIKLIQQMEYGITARGVCSCGRLDILNFLYFRFTLSSTRLTLFITHFTSSTTRLTLSTTRLHYLPQIYRNQSSCLSLFTICFFLSNSGTLFLVIFLSSTKLIYISWFNWFHLGILAMLIAISLWNDIHNCFYEFFQIQITSTLCC
jgi:uncharacterized membrane protein